MPCCMLVMQFSATINQPEPAGAPLFRLCNWLASELAVKSNRPLVGVELHLYTFKCCCDSTPCAKSPISYF